MKPKCCCGAGCRLRQVPDQLISFTKLHISISECIFVNRKHFFKKHRWKTLQMDIDKRNRVIGLFLWVVIIGLSYVLFDSIWTPYQEVLEQRREQQEVRDRMESLRDALIAYERENEEFPEDLDQLIEFLQTDSLMVARRDSLFADGFTNGFNLDQFTYSPRPPGNRFEYAPQRHPSPRRFICSRILIRKDRIGSLERTTMLNALKLGLRSHA